MQYYHTAYFAVVYSMQQYDKHCYKK